jgi:hypothetical protein
MATHLHRAAEAIGAVPALDDQRPRRKPPQSAAGARGRPSDHDEALGTFIAAAAPGLDDLIDAATLRRLCGDVSDMTIRRWCDRGILPQPRRILRRRYWRRGAVLAALDAHQEPPPPSPCPGGPAARDAALGAPK